MEWIYSIASYPEKHLSSSATLDHPTLFLFPSSPSITTASQALKRRRSCFDVDGEGSGNQQKKKRRLRLKLITSRLSRPYATPATHIISRHASKFSAWARSRTPGDGFFRKAALLNRFRIRKAITKHPRRCYSAVERRLLCEGRCNSNLLTTTSETGCRHSHPPPRCGPRPSVPSPLGMSNEDDLDNELDLYEGQFDDTDDESINSDFSIMKSDESSTELGIFEGRVSGL